MLDLRESTKCSDRRHICSNKSNNFTAAFAHILITCHTEAKARWRMDAVLQCLGTLTRCCLTWWCPPGTLAYLGQQHNWQWRVFRWRRQKDLKVIKELQGNEPWRDTRHQQRHAAHRKAPILAKVRRKYARLTNRGPDQEVRATKGKQRKRAASIEPRQEPMAYKIATVTTLSQQQIQRRMYPTELDRASACAHTGTYFCQPEHFPCLACILLNTLCNSRLTT
jgi:hypothetical protein